MKVIPRWKYGLRPSSQQERFMLAAGRHCIVHTYFDDGTFSTYEALILGGLTGSNRIIALVVMPNGAIRLTNMLSHYTERSSAHYWCWPDERVDAELA